MKYRPDIDGLRALAVLPVVFYHAGFPGFSGGYVGVDVFFVISGYLITSIIVSELAAGSFSLRRFYERRARRILPALTVVSLACVPFAWAWMTPDHLKEFGESLAAVAVFASNFLFWRESGYFATDNEIKPLIHTWSLAIEEQYYIIVPLLLMVIWKWGRRRLSLCLLAIAVASLAVAESKLFGQAGDFYLLPSRGWELAIGALLAAWEQRRGTFQRARFGELATAAGLAMLGGAVVLFNDDTPHPGVVTLIPVLGSALLIRFAGQDRLAGPLLSSRPFVAVGLISYSLYLWHQPVFAFARIRSIDALHVTEYLVLIGLSLVLAALSWRFVERPFRDRNRVPVRRIWIASAASVLALGVLGGYGHYSFGAPQRFPEEAELMKYVGKASSLKPRKKRPGSGDVIGVRDGSPTYALVGDSHAGMLWRPMDQKLAARGESALLLTAPGCPYAPGLRRMDPGEDCARWSARVKKKLATPEISTVILVGRYVNLLENRVFDNGEGGVTNMPAGYMPVEKGRWIRDDGARRAAVAARYRAAVTDLLDMGKRVVLIYPVPEAGWDVPHTLFKLHRAGSTRQLTTSYEVYRARSRAVIEAFDSIGEHANLVRVHPDRLFCDTAVPGRCVTHSAGGEIYYKDNNHLTRTGARRLVKAVLGNL